MDYKTAYTAIQGYFATAWAGATTVLYDDDPAPTPNAETWVRLNIRHTDGFQVSMGDVGNNRFNRTGVIIIQIFQKQGQYGIAARDLAKNALQLFEGVTDNGVHYFDASVREIGADGHGWYQINVVANFRYDELV